MSKYLLYVVDLPFLYVVDTFSPIRYDHPLLFRFFEGDIDHKKKLIFT